MGLGTLVISLDFELHWGAPEKWDIVTKKHYFDETRKSIPKVLKLFKQYNVHATWATVGFLFAKDREQLMAFAPKEKPTYKDKQLNYYAFFEKNEVGDNEVDDPYHFAGSLISKIIATPGQELATHTFSHFYCNEPGQNLIQFDYDLKAAQSIAKKNFGISLESLVFPRNQFNADYLDVARKNGIKVVRSNPDVWFWKKTSSAMALARALDTLFPISNKLSYGELQNKAHSEILCLPASRFLRPYSAREKLIQDMKLNRIKREMTDAAKNNKVYHLWWHPHNFGNEMNENLKYLESILKHFKFLDKKYKFSSKSMIEMYLNQSKNR